MLSHAENRKKGSAGEEIASKFLEKQGFCVVCRNFQRKWGELDIIAKKDNIIHFFEVKSVTSTYSLKYFDSHQPENNVDNWKTLHIRRMVETYLSYARLGPDTEFQFHVLSIFMNMQTRKARVKWLKNIVL